MVATPGARPPASPDKATLLVIRPSAIPLAVVGTVVELPNGQVDRPRFVGENESTSYFYSPVPAGEHTFAVCGNGSAALRATVAPGRVYVVEVDMTGLDVSFVPIKLREEQWPLVRAWLAKSKAMIADTASGQASVQNEVRGCIEDVRLTKNAAIPILASDDGVPTEEFMRQVFGPR